MLFITRKIIKYNVPNETHCSLSIIHYPLFTTHYSLKSQFLRLLYFFRRCLARTFLALRILIPPFSENNCDFPPFVESSPFRFTIPARAASADGQPTLGLQAVKLKKEKRRIIPNLLIE